MKPAGLLLLIPAGLAAVALAAETPTGLVSRETKARILEGLPTYQPPSTTPGADNPTSGSPQTTDPNVLILPKLLVKEKRFPAVQRTTS